MLLKKFLKNRADDEKEEEVSLEELQERKIRLVRSIKRKAMIKRILVILILFFGVAGGYKALFDTGEENSYTELKDQAFVSAYITDYYSYPRSDETKDRLKNFTLSDDAYSYEYASDVESVDVRSVTIYNTEKLDSINQIYSYYIKCTYDVKVKDRENAVNTMFNKITVGKNGDKYKVIRPVTNIKNEAEAVKDKDVLDSYGYDPDKGSESVDEETKSDVKNTIELFLKTYNDDITQARLLFLEPDRLLPLDDNSSLELNGMSDVTKSEDTYYVNFTLKQTVSEMQMILKYHFEIDIEKNKVKVMEVY